MSLERAIRGVLSEQIAPKEIKEDGHDDVSMAKTKVKVAMAAIQKMNTELSKLPDEGDLPSWWVGKVAVAVDKLDGMADYLDTQVEDASLVKVAKALKKSVKAHDKQADTIMKHVKDMEEENVDEKKLTPAELKKREEVAKAIERENPKMPMDQKMAIATATAKKVAEENIQTEGKARDRLVKMVDKASGRTMADREKDAAAATASRKAADKDLANFKKANEAYNEPQGQAKSMMSPLQKARMDKEKADRDRDGKLKPGVVKVKKEEVEVEEAKKVSSMQIHKVLAKTKNAREGVAALKKAFRVNDREAQMMLKKVMNEATIPDGQTAMTTKPEVKKKDKDTISKIQDMMRREREKKMKKESLDEISRSMKPMSKRFGKAVDAKKFDAYKKHVKQHKVDEPTVRFIDDNPNHNQSKRAMQDKHVAQAVKLYKDAHKESVDEVLDTPDRVMNYKHRAKYSRDRARNSQAAHMLRGTDPSKDKDTERKRDAGLKSLNKNVAGKIRKSMMSNEEIEEAKKPDETVNIRQSLKKAIDMRGQKEVVFKDGSKAKISVQDAQKAMKMLDNTRMAKAKQDLTIRMMKSHQEFKNALAGKKPKVDPFALRVRTNEEVKNMKNEKFANAAQQAAVMAKLKASGKYKEPTESAAADNAVRRHQMALANARAAMKQAKTHDQMVKAMNAVRFHQKAVDNAMHSENKFLPKFKSELKELKKSMKETKGAPKGYHFTRSGQLKKGDAGQDGDGGKMLRSDPLDKQRKKIPPLPENDK